MERGRQDTDHLSAQYHAQYAESIEPGAFAGTRVALIKNVDADGDGVVTFFDMMLELDRRRDASRCLFPMPVVFARAFRPGESALITPPGLSHHLA